MSERTGWTLDDHNMPEVTAVVVERVNREVIAPYVVLDYQNEHGNPEFTFEDAETSVALMPAEEVATTLVAYGYPQDYPWIQTDVRRIEHWDVLGSWVATWYISGEHVTSIHIWYDGQNTDSFFKTMPDEELRQYDIPLTPPE